MAHERMLIGGNPLLVILPHKLAKCRIGLYLLHLQQLIKIGFGAGKRKFPMYQAAVHLTPVLKARGFINHSAYVTEFLLVVMSCLLGN